MPNFVPPPAFPYNGAQILGPTAAPTSGHALTYNGSEIAGALIPGVVPQGRLTLTTATPVTTSDVTGATTLYYTPYTGIYTPCIVGSSLVMRTFSELSQATTDNTKSPAAVAASKVYDIFLWDDSGTLRATRGPAWSSDTSRGTGAGTSEIAFSSTFGFYLNSNDITNGPAAGKGILLGTIRSDSSSQLADSAAFRWVSNIYNAVPRFLNVTDGTNTWTYSTVAFRQANNNAANQVDVVIPLPSGYVSLQVLSLVISSTTTYRFATTGIGLDRTNGNDAILKDRANVNSQALKSLYGTYKGFPGIGRHYFAWLESGDGTDTQTWTGDAGFAGFYTTGLAGEVMG